MNARKYGFTKAEYERVFIEKPDEIIWENDELRFDEDYTRKVYFNLTKLCLTHCLKLKNPDFLSFPNDDNLKMNKVNLDEKERNDLSVRLIITVLCFLSG